MDTAFPATLPSFLNSCAPRPKAFEEICRALWKYDEAPAESKATLRPVWLPRGGDASLARCRDAFRIEQWWFTSLLVNIAEALAEFRDVLSSRHAVPGLHILVSGLSTALSKQLPSTVRLQEMSPMEVIKACKASGLDLHTVELKNQPSLQGASVAIFRGISYRGGRLPPDGDGDREDDMMYNDGRSRFVMLRYFLDGQHAGASLHYVVGVDRTKQVLPFEMSWIVRYPKTKRFDVQCHLGPYAGPAFEHFKLMGDQETAVRSALDLEWILSTEHLLDKLISPDVLRSTNSLAFTLLLQVLAPARLEFG